jgi:uncharacterized protein (TIGR02996 family)
MAKKKASGHDRAFLDDVAAHPEDDGPRLVYADWLDDNGQPHRAELIRIQCRLATMGENDPERLDLEYREADLLCVHARQWEAALPAWVLGQYAFRRGFPDRISLTASELLRSGPTVFAAAPATALSIRNLVAKVPQVAACPLLGRVTAVNFEDNRLSPDDLRILGASPHLGALREVMLTAPNLTDRHAEALAGWPFLPRLRRLGLGMGSADVLGALVGRGRLASLRRLTTWTAHRPASIRALAEEAPALADLETHSSASSAEMLQAVAALPNLTTLRFFGYGIVDALVNVAVVERLSSLDLGRGSLSRRGVAALAGGDRLARLRRLSLRVNLGEEGAGLLASAALSALTRLELPDTGLDAAAVRLLAASPRLAGLRWLDLSDNPFGNDGAAALAASPHLTALDSLDLEDCGIGPAGAAALAASPMLSRLRRLRLTRNPLGDEGARALAESPHLGGLRVLELDWADLGESGVRWLARSRTLVNLRRVDLQGNSREAKAAAAQEFADPSRLPSLLVLSLEFRRRDPSDLTDLGREVKL